MSRCRQAEVRQLIALENLDRDRLAVAAEVEDAEPTCGAHSHVLMKVDCTYLFATL